MARPTKLTPELQKTITDAVKIGATYESAAEYAGIARRTLDLWKEKGRAHPGGLYGQFMHALEQANAQAKISLLGKIQEADDWRSKAWILERRFPAEFGATLKQELTGENGGPVAVSIVEVIAPYSAPPDEPEAGGDTPGVP